LTSARASGRHKHTEKRNRVPRSLPNRKISPPQTRARNRNNRPARACNAPRAGSEDTSNGHASDGGRGGRNKNRRLATSRIIPSMSGPEEPRLAPQQRHRSAARQPGRRRVRRCKRAFRGAEGVAVVKGETQEGSDGIERAASSRTLPV
jgi:hypothetical protein